MKKRMYIAPIFVAAFLCSHAQQSGRSNYLAHIRQADSLYMAGDPAGASRAFAEAFHQTEDIQPHHLYNAACAAAKAGDNELAFDRLFGRIALEKEWYSDRIGTDGDLQPLHADARWQLLLDTLAARQHRAERDFDMPLRRKLQQIAASDQLVRTAYVRVTESGANRAVTDSLIVEMQRTDSLNLREISSILDSRGWVGKTRVGDACTAFFLVIQHSDPATQERYLPLLRQGAAQGDIRPLQVAMLEDRIAVGKGEPQRYGSQVLRHGDGSYYIAPLLDADRVDEWRREVGMGPVAEYLKRWGIEWPAPEGGDRTGNGMTSKTN